MVRGNPQVADGQVRPGGDLVACMSNESGESQVYLTRFPSGEVRWQVAVTVAGNPTLGRPERPFSRPPTGQGAFSWHSGFDLTADGSRFVINRPAGDRTRPPSVTVIQNWYSEFKGKK